jgi:hypothetical protein
MAFLFIVFCLFIYTGVEQRDRINCAHLRTLTTMVPKGAAPLRNLLRAVEMRIPHCVFVLFFCTVDALIAVSRVLEAAQS